ncbi:MAG: hypothetical protein H8E28_14400, partial [Anaerolineae bacterium]|nr:hypothetical protein [Anaerolineae bacterium]
MAHFPDQDTLLSAPDDAFHKIAPFTMIYGASGTRRAAALAGVKTSGQIYADWTQGELFRAVGVIFRHGVRHLVMPMLGPSQFEEATPEYHKYLWRWFVDGLAGENALAHYQSEGWRVRIVCSQLIPNVQMAGQRLIENTPFDSPHTLWCYVVPDYNQPWEWLLQSVSQSKAINRSEAMLAMYGEKIPSAEIYIGTGKLQMSSLQLPPLLVNGPLQCYWSQ